MTCRFCGEGARNLLCLSCKFYVYLDWEQFCLYLDGFLLDASA